jgi:hypothetical protein
MIQLVPKLRKSYCQLGFKTLKGFVMFGGVQFFDGNITSKSLQDKEPFSAYVMCFKKMMFEYYILLQTSKLIKTHHGGLPCK